MDARIAYFKNVYLNHTSMDAPPWFSQYVRISQGDMPVVLDAPHGGSFTREGLRVRPGPKPGRDLLTLEYAYAIQERVRAACSRSPTIVACLLHRRYVDLNHARQDCCVDPVLQQFHDYYYSQLQAQLDLCAPRWSRRLLVDIHGFDPANLDESLRSYDVILGTRSNATITCQDNFIDPAKKIFISALRAQGVAVFPPDVATPEERYFGGHIVSHFGQTLHIPAMQVELSNRARGQDRDVKGRVLTAFATFMKEWLESLS